VEIVANIFKVVIRTEDAFLRHAQNEERRSIITIIETPREKKALEKERAGQYLGFHLIFKVANIFVRSWSRHRTTDVIDNVWDVFFSYVEV